MQVIYSSNVCWLLAMLLSKEAILLLYFEVFQVKRRLRLTIIFTMTVTGLVYGAAFIIICFICRGQLGASLVHQDGHNLSKCERLRLYNIFMSVFGVVLDLAIFALPIRPVLELQMSLRQKLRALAVFATAML